MNEEQRQQQISEHLEAIRRLEATIDVEGRGDAGWPPDRFYLLWHVVVGMMLGSFGALVSLLANTVGAPLFGHRPFELIRVYLTFPMGAEALTVDEGVVLFVGCLLYLVTGALYGILFHLLFAVTFAEAPLGKRFAVATALGLGLWLLNFYGILSWLQPMLLGGNWIVSRIPIWVGALTHLLFAWTVLGGETLGARWGTWDPARSGAASSQEARHA